MILALALLLAAPKWELPALVEKVEADLEAWDVEGAQKGLDELLVEYPDAQETAYYRGRVSVVVCGHALYNVADLMPFLSALNDAAERRVVVEITRSHPRNRALERALWRHFWNLERPQGPNVEDAVAVMRQAGIEPNVEPWESQQRGGFHSLEELVSWMRRTVCLDPGREGEVRTIVLQYATERDGQWRLSPEPRALATLWWDVPSPTR